MSFDHIGYTVPNFLKSRDFYVSALAPLDIGIVHEGPDWAAFGENGRVLLWIGSGPALQASIHIAFAARDKAAVAGFHAAATEAGGRDNGAPDYRPQYHPGYYAAFVLDPDGHNIEAVFHERV